MKKILVAALLLSIFRIASAQSPSPTVNGTPPPFIFTGPGVSQSGQTFTFTGTGTGLGSITWALPAFMVATPATISTAGTQTFSFSSQANHTFLGNNSGASAAPTFVTPTLADIAAGASSTGLYDFSGATNVKLPVSAAYASAANGELGYDSTNLNWHGWLNGADYIIAFLPTAGITSGHCAQFLKTTNSWSLSDAGAACGTGSGVTSVSVGNLSPVFTASVANPTTAPSISFTLSSAAAYSLLFNNSASSAAPTYVALSSLPAAQFPTLNQNTTGLAGGLSGSPVNGQFWGYNGTSQGWYTPTGSGGTTTNALTFNTSGGDSPATTFNGSAAVTVDYHTVGAAAAVTNQTDEATNFSPTCTSSHYVTASVTATLPSSVSTGCIMSFQVKSGATLTVSSGTVTYTGPTTVTGPWAFSIQTDGTNFNAVAQPSSAGIANIQITVGTTAITANSCTAGSTATMTGLATTSAIKITPSTDVSATTGWSPAAGGQLYFTAWPTANTLNYKVCNPTNASITPGASTTWNVSAQ